MSLNTEQLCIITTDESLRRVSAGIAINLADVVAPDRANVISADEVIVAGEVKTNGHSLTILARRVIFSESGRIVADGLVGMPNISAGQAYESAHTPGAMGVDGEDGGAGRSSGNVTITAEEVLGQVDISAVGGTGGRPRDGGNGFIGAKGASGANRTTYSVGAAPAECHAQGGGQGGASGLPGRRGPGGAGGMVRLHTRAVVEAGRCVIKVAGGAPSEPGVPGIPGRGGPGGDGGTWSVRECVPIDHRRNLRVESIPGLSAFEKNKSALAFPALEAHLASPGLLLHSAAATIAAPIRDHCVTTVQARMPQGAEGPQGSPRTDEVAARVAVPSPAPADGRLDLVALAAAPFAAAFDGESLDLMVMAAEDRYRQAGLGIDDSLRATLEFLLAVCSDDPAPDSIKRELLGRVYVMARRITLGLDFYGYAREDAPLVSFETYRNIVDVAVIPHARLIEETYQTYRDAHDANKVELGVIRSARSQAVQQRGNFADELDRVTKEATIIRDQLDPLDNKVVACFALLMQREAQLTAAINSRRNGCNLLGTLQACAVIVAGVASGGAGFIAAAGAGAKLFQDLDSNSHSLAELWDERKLIGDDLKELGKQANTVDEAIDAIQEGFKKLNPERPRVPAYTMERSKFDQVASEFQSLPQAAAYKEAGYAYLAAVETRNAAIVSYNGQLTQSIELAAAIRGADRAVAGLDTVLSGKRNPADAGVVAMMTRLYRDTLALASMMVHTERKALAYHFVTPADAPLSAFNVATIAAAHQRAVLRDWASAKERFAVKRDLEPGQLELDLASIAGPEAWQEFKKTGAIDFVIRPDHPKYKGLLGNLFGLRLTGMELVLEGVKAAPGQDQLPWDMTQGGSEMILRRSASPVRFTHRAITFGGTTSLSGKKPIVVPDFSERNLYAGVSPYASWLLVFKSISEVGLDLSHLSRASLKLHGYLIE